MQIDFSGKLNPRLILQEPNIENLSGDSPELLSVESVDNHVYFYADVNADRGLALMRKLRETADTLRSEHLRRSIPGEPPPIWLHVHSYGGDTFSGFAIADQLEKLGYPVWSIVEGAVCSAGTFVSMPCQKRFIMPNAFMLVHEFKTLFYGKHEEFKDEMELQKRLIDRLASFYVTYSKLDDERVREMLTHDTWFNAEEALATGLVDGYWGE